MTLLIHIGYHKTATTFLQEQIFNQENFGFVSPWSRYYYIESNIKTSNLIDIDLSHYNYQMSQNINNVR